MKKTTDEWFKSAKSDLLLIRKVSTDADLTHLSAFHSQQAIEKSIKAMIEEYDLGFIKTHSLETLFNIVKDIIPVEINIDILVILDQLYIDSRYPGEMGLLPNGKPTITEAMEFFNLARKFFEAAKSVCQRH